MFDIEICWGKSKTIVENLPKVVHSSMYEIFILWTNIRPQSGKDEINILYSDNFNILYSNV